MTYITLSLCDRFYNYMDGNSIEMEILGDFFSREVRCGQSSWESWILDDNQGMGTSGNTISLEKEGDCVYISDLYDEDGKLQSDSKPIQLKISRQQLVQLICNWKEKVCKTMPKEVTIIRNGDEFTLETKD